LRRWRRCRSRRLRLKYRARADQRGQREHQRDQHKSCCCADGYLGKQSRRAARPECRARNAAGKKRARVRLARLQQHSDDEHHARQNKKPVQNVR